MDYKASLDTLSKVITAGIFVLFIGFGQKNVKAILAAHGNLTPTLIHGSVLLLFVAVIACSYLYSTSDYTVTGSELIIRRPVRDRIIKIADIAEIRTAEAGEFSGTIRTFGNGGLFGYYGKYYNSKLGHMTWYVTQKKNRVIILTQKGNKIVITPDDIGLVTEVKSKMEDRPQVTIK
jgi:hypothetical protein